MDALTIHQQIAAAWPADSWRIPGPDSAIRTREGELLAIEEHAMWWESVHGVALDDGASVRAGVARHAWRRRQLEMIDTPQEAAVHMVATGATVEYACALWGITLAQLQAACGERDEGHTYMPEDDGISRKTVRTCRVCSHVAEPQEGPEP